MAEKTKTIKEGGVKAPLVRKIAAKPVLVILFILQS